MRESERQIQLYQKQLPKMRERVFAALSILIVALIMSVSATFAWFVLSENPEVKGMNTTITANGNLEIALANGTTITDPADSEVGDSGKDLVVKNTTWGNLINLGDEAYGLEHIVLRPASLNQNSLLEQPLYGAGYGNDGRVETLVNNFAYAYWKTDQFSADMVRYGVRTVSSVTYGSIGQNTALAEAVSAAQREITTAGNNLRLIAQHDSLQDLVGLMGRYIQAQIDEKLSGSEDFVKISADEVESIYYLMNELKETIEQSAEALSSTYNIAMLRRAGAQYVSTNKFTGNYLLTATQADIQTKLSAKNGTETIVQPTMVSLLWQLRTDYNQLCSDIEIIDSYRGRNDVVYRNLNGSTYPAIETYVNHITDVASTTVNGTAIGSLSMSNISSLTGGGSKPIVINKGIIQRMDKFTGADIESKELSVSIKVLGMGSTAKGKATTSATEPYVLSSEYNAAVAGDTSFKGTDPIAGDTFGMALDFFVRTNAEDAHLILQGSPVYEEREETAKAKIGNDEYTLYTVTVDDTQIIVYEKEGVYYEYDRESKIAGAQIGTTQEITNATVLIDKVKYVVGYSGVNRVWEETESPLLDSTSTTQGAGSCYVFYPATPEDQDKSLKLLEHFRVAFISEDGKLLGTAQMDTKNKAAQSGKVTVPLVLSVTNDSIMADNGETIYTITQLERNEATFITALIYLDGTSLTNDQVLAAGEIQGQLNIQFGTTADIDALDDPALMESKCTVSATMEGATTVPIDSTDAERLKTVTVTVDGYTPDRVEAYFLREINSTQGIRQRKMVFRQSGDNWVGSHQFTASGKYILREVVLDGVAYELESPIIFTVEGFTISDVFCEHDGKSYMTTEKSFDTSLSLTFSTSDVRNMPSSVKGAFIHEGTGNRTTVYFKRATGGTWTGEATLTTSGHYKLEYLELDGEYTGLDPEQYITIDLMLGLTTYVYTGDSNFALENGESRDINMSLDIKNDAGASVGKLSGIWLQYSHNGSSVIENGVSAQMQWNDSTGLYEGTFHIEKAGIYKYQFVSINIDGEDNTLYTSAVSPSITAISSNPPRYVSKSGFGEAFSLTGEAAFNIRMRNADAATIDAKISNENGETFYLRGTMKDLGGNEQEFTFVLPVINGVQSGTYTLESIYLTNIYGGANNALYDGSTENGPDTVTEQKPMYSVSENYYFRWLEMPIDEITNEGEEQATIAVVSNVNVELSNSPLNANKIFGKEGDNVTATFGTVHTLSAIELKITAGNDKRPLSDFGITVSGVELKYGYDQTSVQKQSGTTTVYNPFGSYSIDSESWVNLSSVTNTEYVYNNISQSASDNTIYTISPNKTQISIAGRYIAAEPLIIKLKAQNGTEIELKKQGAEYNALNLPNIQVWSKAMSVSIKSMAPNKANHKSVNKTAETEVTRTSSFSGNYATIYCEAHKSGNNIAFDTYPYVELSLANKGSGTVTLPFTRTGGGEVYLYTAEKMGGNKVTGYEWTNSADCTRYVGQYKAGSTCSSTSFTGAGTLTASTLNIEHEGYTYMMAVDTVTIKNPHIEDE